MTSSALVRRGHVIAAAVLAAVGLAALIGAIQLGVLGDDGRIGSGFMPAVVGAGVLVLALVDLLQTALRTPATSSVDELLYEQLVEGRPETTDQLETVSDLDVLGRDQRTRNRQLVLVIVALVVAVALVPVVGLLVSLGLLMAFAALVVERRRVLPSLIVVAATLGVLYLLFVVFLGVPLPEGLLGEVLP